MVIDVEQHVHDGILVIVNLRFAAALAVEDAKGAKS